jgi:excisionase family DNA binding protein
MKPVTPDPGSNPIHFDLSALIRSLAEQIAAILKSELEGLKTGKVPPALFDVKQAAAYLGRSEHAMEHMIFQRDLPVVRVGRRVQLHRTDLDAWIEKNKE